MSNYDNTRKAIRDSHESINKAVEEAKLFVVEESERARLIALLGNVSEALVRVDDSFVEDEDRANYEDKPAEEVREDSLRDRTAEKRATAEQKRR